MLAYGVSFFVDPMSAQLSNKYSIKRNQCRTIEGRAETTGSDT